MKNLTTLIANRAAKNYGSNRATEIRKMDGETMQLRAAAGKSLTAHVVRYSGYHWTTPGGKPVQYPSAYSRAFGKPVYHGADCVVAAPDIDAIYSCDAH